MTHFDDARLATLNASGTKGRPGFSELRAWLRTWFGAWIVKTLARLVEPKFDLDRTNARMRRDAGIDELEFERDRAGDAPLIR